VLLRCIQMPSRDVGKKRQRVAQGGLEHGIAVAAATRRAGEIDDQRPPDDARNAAREQAVRRLGDRVRAQRLCDPGRLALQDGPRRFRGDVAWREPGAPGCQDDCGPWGDVLDRSRDLVRLIGDDTPLDLVAVGAQKLLEQIAASVVGLAARDAVAALSPTELRDRLRIAIVRARRPTTGLAPCARPVVDGVEAWVVLDGFQLDALPAYARARLPEDDSTIFATAVFVLSYAIRVGTPPRNANARACPSWNVSVHSRGNT